VLRKGYILAVLVIVASIGTAFSIFASAEEGIIPSWIKNTAEFWVNGDIPDSEFLSSIKWMVENRLIQISEKQDNNQQQIELLEKQRDDYKKQLDELWVKHVRLERDLESPSYNNQPSYDPAPTSGRIQSQECDGYADCFSGGVTEIIDGDTIKVSGQSIRFALVDTPEYGDMGYSQATNFIASICPVGSIVLVDEDDMQTQGSYGRIIAVVYCNGMNLNKVVLDQGYGKIDTYFCSKSEFEYHSWAQIHGCKYSEPPKTKTESTPKASPPPKATPPPPKPTPPPVTPEPSCDPSYPDVCIPPYPPDLDCGEISYKNFRVVGSDPHGFDGDGDGIGCES